MYMQTAMTQDGSRLLDSYHVLLYSKSMTKYNIGDILHDEMFNQHYIIYGMGWKKAHQRAYKVYCCEKDRFSMFSLYNAHGLPHVKRVA